ncbi:MAG: glycosyltransferase family 2 protein [DPANN group archaeon]|nr:glycosyltransferase family 2 protein [DPANN group archaeon]
MKASIIIPAYNEEEAIEPVVNEILEQFKDSIEIIIVDDGSSDKTYPRSLKLSKEHKNIKVIKHKINQGKVGGIRTGINAATGDYIILTDADYTYPARYITNFIKELDNGADLVLGSRFLNGINNMPLFNRVGNTLFSFLTTYISCVNITDGQTGYRAFRKDMFDKLDVKAKSLEFETKMTVRSAKYGYNIVEIPIEYRERLGTSKLNPVVDGFKMFKALISIGIKETSIISKAIMIPSIMLTIIAFYFGSISIIETIKWYVYSIPAIHGYYPLLTTLLLLISVQVFSIGVVIDYLTKKLDRIEENIKITKGL